MDFILAIPASIATSKLGFSVMGRMKIGKNTLNTCPIQINGRVTKQK